MGPSMLSRFGVARWLRAMVGVLAVVAMCLTGAPHAVASAWELSAAPGPLVPAGQLVAVSCASRRACVAVGSFSGGGGEDEPLIDRWDGSNWTSDDTPLPSWAVSGSLAAVSCRSARVCVAVGSITTTRGHQLPLVERWSDSGWSVVSAPTPRRSTGDSLDGVSCTSPRACIAVGSFTNHAQGELPLSERWRGGRWSLGKLPRLVEARRGSLNAVSCVSDRRCFAVGVETASTGHGRTGPPVGRALGRQSLVASTGPERWTARS